MLDVESLSGIIAAREASRTCEYCCGEGIATIYHIDYDGTCPYVIEHDERGQERKRITRTVAYCVCAAGRWIMFEHQTNSKDVFAKISDLHTIIGWEKSGCLWSPKDRSIVDANSPKTWKEFRERIANGPSVIKQIPRPRYEGNRAQARREMGISPPTPEPQWQPD
jgi:hypothetical protein